MAYHIYILLAYKYIYIYIIGIYIYNIYMAYMGYRSICEKSKKYAAKKSQWVNVYLEFD